MKLRLRGSAWLATAAILFAAPSLLNAQESAGTCPPKTRIENVEDHYGKTVVVDPYRWLEDQDSKQTRAWIKAQDKCTQAALGKLPDREAITKRLTELYRIDSYGLPEEHGGRYFFTKRLAGQDLAQICMRQGAKGEDMVLVDPLPWSPGSLRQRRYRENQPGRKIPVLRAPRRRAGRGKRSRVGYRCT